jgi:pimeloyl-ACP methyl ester carboxylesterase
VEPTKEAYVDWLIDQLEAAGEPVDLVGHDWGSLLAVRAATCRPDLVRTLAFGGGPVDETYVWHDMAQLWQTPEVGEQVMEATTEDAITDGLVAAGLTLGQAAVAAAHLDDEMKRCILGLYRSAVTVGEEWVPAFEGFDRPTVAIWGGADPYAPAAFGVRMAERLGGTTEIFEGGHHWWPLDRPDDVATILTELWNRA